MMFNDYEEMEFGFDEELPPLDMFPEPRMEMLLHEDRLDLVDGIQEHNLVPEPQPVVQQIPGEIEQIALRSLRMQLDNFRAARRGLRNPPRLPLMFQEHIGEMDAFVPPMLPNLREPTFDGWQGPPRYLQMLSKLKERQSKVQNLQELQTLCVKSVLKNLPYFLAKNAPFNNLPGDILNLVIKQLVQENKLTPEVFKLVITNRTKYVSFKQATMKQDSSLVFTTQQFSNLVRNINMKCTESITELHLELNHTCFLQVAVYPSVKDIDTSLGKMSNLRELTLHTGTASDKTLETIGNKCPHIRVLDVANNADISNLGIISMCQNTTSKARQLEILNVDHTAVTQDGICHALVYLPNLTGVSFCHVTRCNITHIIKVFNIKQELKLTKFDLENKNDTIVIPYVKKSTLHLNLNCELQLLEPLNDFQNLTQLTLGKEVPDQHKFRLIQHFGEKLTNLKIIIKQNEIFNLNTVGWFCPNLEILDLKCYGNIQPDNTQYQINDDHFSKLTHLTLKFRTSTPIPNSIMKLMLSAVNLTKLTIENHTLNNSLLTELILEARIHEQIFSNLEHVNLKKSHFQSSTQLLELICVCPKLKSVIMLGCSSLNHTRSEDLHSELSKFVFFNKLNLKL